MLKRSEHCTSLDLLLLRRFLPFFFAFYDNFYFYFNGFPYIPMTTTATRAATSVKFSLLGSTELNQQYKNFGNRVLVKNSHFSDTQTKLLKNRNFKSKKLSNFSAQQPTRRFKKEKSVQPIALVPEVHLASSKSSIQRKSSSTTPAQRDSHQTTIQQATRWRKNPSTIREK